MGDGPQILTESSKPNIVQKLGFGPNLGQNPKNPVLEAQERQI